MDAAEHARLAAHEEWYWWHRARERIVQRLLARHAPRGGRILDVGCGTGATTASLSRFGPVLGLDPGREALAHARARALPVARARAVPLPVREGAFDVVVALDVLEHLEDDAAAVREMRAALAPGGVLVVTVPAYAFLWSSHDEALGHRRRYTRRRLADLLEGAGFRLEVCSYAMSAALPPAAIVRLAERLLPRERRGGRSGYVPVPDGINDLLAWLVALDGHLLRWVRLPFGLSVAAVARRPARS